MNERSELILGGIGLTFEAALESLTWDRELTPSIAAALRLKPAAVANFHKLPAGTREGMIDALVNRLEA
jgi:hypothetical protein